MNWIACDPLIGLPRVPEEGPPPDAGDLTAEMARLGIDRALVRHRAALECGPEAGNRVLREETRDRPTLHPVWFLTPDGEPPDFDPGATLERLRAAGAAVVWMDPEAEGFSPQPWCAGPLYEALQARRVPLLLDYAKIRPDDLHLVLRDFPGLRLILLGVPRLGRNRMVYPLLDRHPNLYVCLSHTFSVHRGIEDLCRRFGPDRWLFGMGYPAAEGGAALAGIAYADIPESAKEAITHGTLERLLAESRFQAFAPNQTVL